jgi:uncharacterized membrane protein YvbJ
MDYRRDVYSACIFATGLQERQLKMTGKILDTRISLKKMVLWYGLFAISILAGILYWLASM